LVLTGAAGSVGRAIRPLLAARYAAVRLTDRVEIRDLAPNERFVPGDLTDPDFVRSLAREAWGIIHLAGLVGPDFTFGETLGPNIIATHHVYEAARLEGVPRVVYASSHHAVGFLPRGSRIDHRTAPRPDSEYGLSKAYGEAAGALYADKHGLQVLVIRIGFVGETVADERRVHTWISARDLVQLIGIGLETPDLGYEVVYGVSDNPEPFFDNANAIRLGYRPQDRSPDVVTDPRLLEACPAGETLEDGVVGGGFAARGFTGDAERILGRK
jgi:uronate dehydrogenase